MGRLLKSKHHSWLRDRVRQCFVLWRKIRLGKKTGEGWGGWGPILDRRVHETLQKSWYLNKSCHWE